MVDKSAFSDEEWGRLLASVFLSAMAVSAAEPSGIIGLIKEGLASGAALREEATRPGEGLVTIIAREAISPEGQTIARESVAWRMEGAERDQIRMRAISGIRQAMMLLNARAPEDAPHFAELLAKVAQATAEAAVEGGFLGIGGERVSEAEKATLAEIRQVVGLG